MRRLARAAAKSLAARSNNQPWSFTNSEDFRGQSLSCPNRPPAIAVGPAISTQEVCRWANTEKSTEVRSRATNLHAGRWIPASMGEDRRACGGTFAFPQNTLNHRRNPSPNQQRFSARIQSAPLAEIVGHTSAGRSRRAKRRSNSAEARSGTHGDLHARNYCNRSNQTQPDDYSSSSSGVGAVQPLLKLRRLPRPPRYTMAPIFREPSAPNFRLYPRVRR